MDRKASPTYMLLWTIWRKLTLNHASGNSRYFAGWQCMYYMLKDQTFLFLHCRWNWISVELHSCISNIILQICNKRDAISRKTRPIKKEVAAGQTRIQELQHNYLGFKWKYSVGTKSKQWQKFKVWCLTPYGTWTILYLECMSFFAFCSYWVFSLKAFIIVLQFLDTC